MARRTALLISVLVALSLLFAAGPATAATATMTGRIELISVRYQQGPVIEIYGWAKLSGAEVGNNNAVRVTLTGPDGAAVSTAFDQPLLATHQFDNGVDDHPGRDQFGNIVHHGFWTIASPTAPGVYRACASAAPGFPGTTWTSLGCSSVTVPPRAVDGAVTGIGPHPGKSGLYIDGWLSDSWDRHGWGRFEVTYTPASGVPADQRPPRGLVGGPYTAPPPSELASQHPGAIGLHSVVQVIDPAPPGTYTVCATFGDENAGLVTDPSCRTITIDSAYATSRATGPGTSNLVVGRAVSMTPGTWVPADATVVDRLIWQRGASDGAGWNVLSDVDLDAATIASTTPGGSMVLPVEAAGHRVCLVETASTVGGVPVSDYSCYDAVIGEVSTTRLSGADRYATAAAISRAAFPGTGPRTVYIASGASFADALSVGPVVAKNHASLLLTAPSSLPSVTRTELSRLHPARIVVVGGAGAVSEQVLTQLRSLAPSVSRIWGADRYATSRAVIASAFPTGTAGEALVATGRDFPDAVAAVPAAIARSAPILLVDGAAGRADAATVAELRRLGVQTVTVLGGTGAVTTGVSSSLSPSAKVVRAAGADRYETALAVARLAAPGPSADAYIAVGADYPDALAAATLQGVRPGAIYLAPATCTPAAVVGDLVRTGVERVSLLGGYGVLGFSAVTACPARN